MTVSLCTLPLTLKVLMEWSFFIIAVGRNKIFCVCVAEDECNSLNSIYSSYLRADTLPVQEELLSGISVYSDWLNATWAAVQTFAL